MGDVLKEHRTALEGLTVEELEECHSIAASGSAWGTQKTPRPVAFVYSIIV